MPRAHPAEVQVLALAECRQHRSSVGLHEAVVVESVVGLDLHEVHVKEILGAVVHAKGIAGEYAGCAVVVGKDCVRPVQVGCNHKLQQVAAAKIDLVAVLDLLGLEVKVHQVRQELEAHLGAEDGRIGGHLDDVWHQPGVVRLRVAHNDVVQLGEIQLPLQRRDVQLPELLVGGVDESCLFASIDDVGVVCGSVLQAELDVKPVPVPVQAAQGRSVISDRR
mmetsp:Transcript_29244/g.82533  ORF Transcript_29244/g.82533 Transcript_29244/m.82533 type:complete len:221 (+) Transcript_29244:1197-1859(+)